MRIGLLGDAHGNAVATNAVLRFLHNEGISKLLFCGDAVGYNAEPSCTLKCLRDSEVDAVVGNHDAMLLGRIPVEGSYEIERSIIQARAGIANDMLSWVATWPERREIELDGIKVQMLHGSPTSLLHGRFNPWMEGMASDARGLDYLIVGHTHLQFAFSSNDTIVVNPGSCGLSRDGDPRAACAMLDLHSHSISFYRLVYNTQFVIDSNLTAGAGTEMCARLIAGSKICGVPDFRSKTSLWTINKICESLRHAGYIAHIQPAAVWVEMDLLFATNGLVMLIALETPPGGYIIRTTPLCHPWQSKTWGKVLRAALLQNTYGYKLEVSSFGCYLQQGIPNQIAGGDVHFIYDKIVRLIEISKNICSELCAIK